MSRVQMMRLSSIEFELHQSVIRAKPGTNSRLMFGKFTVKPQAPRTSTSRIAASSYLTTLPVASKYE